MATREVERDEAEVPELAVQALTDAHRRAVMAGYPLVLVKDGFLVRLGASGTTVLKQLPARKTVSVRTKSARS